MEISEEGSFPSPGDLAQEVTRRRTSGRSRRKKIRGMAEVKVGVKEKRRDRMEQSSPYAGNKKDSKETKKEEETANPGSSHSDSLHRRRRVGCGRSYIGSILIMVFVIWWSNLANARTLRMTHWLVTIFGHGVGQVVTQSCGFWQCAFASEFWHGPDAHEQGMRERSNIVLHILIISILQRRGPAVRHEYGQTAIRQDDG